MTDKDYNECVKLYADNVYRFILKNLRNEEDAKDVVQGAYEKMWVNRVQVDNTKCRSFLFTVAYNNMIDHIRKNKRIVLKDDFNETALGASRQQQNTKRILQEALSKQIGRAHV